jgi:glycosidase
MQQSFQPLPWVRSTNIYEVNLRQYTPEGSFRAFRSEMPRLREMGVEVLWFMPVTPISQKNRKGSLGSYYACSDHTNTNPEYGTLDDFGMMVREAHELGMKVIIDWVANHTGWDHRWTTEHPDFYKHNEQGEFYDSHGWDDVIDLDYGNAGMRMAMIDAMAFWVERFDIDGFRCDMAMLTPVDFWMEARALLDRRKPLFWLAELDPWDNEAHMQVFDAAYTWKWMHTAREYHQPWHRNMAQLDSVLMHYDSLQPKTMLPVWFTSNHDENSWNGTEYEKYGDMALPLAVFSATWRGLPLIYSGQELPNHKRLQFFDRDPIEWRVAPMLHDFYRRLLGLRASHPALVSDGPESRASRLATSHDSQVFAFLRRSGDREVLVILNLCEYEHWDFTIRDEKVQGSFRELFTEEEKDLSSNRNIGLKPWAYMVWVK